MFVYRKLLCLTLGGLLALGVSAMPLFAQQAAAEDSSPWVVKKRGVEMDIRSEGRMLGDRLKDRTVVLHRQQRGNPQLLDPGFVPRINVPRGNIQVNDGSLDYFLDLSDFGIPPLVLYTQNQPAFAVYGRNIVATYNTSAGEDPGFVTLFFTGFSSSGDGGRTWTSGFLPPVQNSIETFGDASVAVDRQGHFYVTSMGVDAALPIGKNTVQINKATHGELGWPSNWGNAVVVQQDDGRDKPWMAVGPDPVLKDRDNVYITWTSFQDNGTQLRFGRSIDSGATWSTQVLSVSNPNLPDKLSYSVPFVDASTGRLYIPFLHFGGDSAEDENPDFIRILISDDGGQTFSFAIFNAPRTPDPTLLPIVSAGTLTDCGNSSRPRLTIHAGPDVGGGQTGADGKPLPRFVQAARLVTQPAFAARNGHLYLAWSNSRSRVFGDGKGSDIRFMWSDNGGKTWKGPMQVNPIVQNDIHHVLPTLAIKEDSRDNEDSRDHHPTVYISYYTQHRDGTVDVDTASSDQDDGSFTFTAVRVTIAPFALAPTNIPLQPENDPFNFGTVNYDFLFFACANLGEYMSAKVTNGTSYVMWTDSRNTVSEPSDPCALAPPKLKLPSCQTHPQQDIFFEAMPTQ